MIRLTTLESQRHSSRLLRPQRSAGHMDQGRSVHVVSLGPGTEIRSRLVPRRRESPVLRLRASQPGFGYQNRSGWEPERLLDRLLTDDRNGSNGSRFLD